MSTKTIGFALTCLFGVGAVLGMMGLGYYHAKHVAPVNYPIRFGIEKPGVQLMLVDTMPHSNPDIFYELQIRHFSFNKKLATISDLRGLVNIKNNDRALQFVRLITATNMWDLDLWPGEDDEEIMSDSYAKSVPLLGPDRYGTGGNGYLGVVSDRAYKLGHFTPPTVTTCPGGFRIARWILVWDRKYHVDKIEETVGSDGAYSRVVLKSMTPPKLPNTDWQVITIFE